MPEQNGASVMPDELAGKAKRVIGLFVFMVGSGIVLESPALWAGVPLMLAGAVTFLWGVVPAHPRTVVSVEERESTPAAAHPTESNL